MLQRAGATTDARRGHLFCRLIATHRRQAAQEREERKRRGGGRKEGQRASTRQAGSRSRRARARALAGGTRRGRGFGRRTPFFIWARLGPWAAAGAGARCWSQSKPAPNRDFPGDSGSNCCGDSGACWVGGVVGRVPRTRRRAGRAAWGARRRGSRAPAGARAPLPGVAGQLESAGRDLSEGRLAPTGVRRRRRPHERCGGGIRRKGSACPPSSGCFLAPLLAKSVTRTRGSRSCPK